jgi:hypothetical protein
MKVQYAGDEGTVIPAHRNPLMVSMACISSRWRVSVCVRASSVLLRGSVDVADPEFAEHDKSLAKTAVPRHSSLRRHSLSARRVAQTALNLPDHRVSNILWLGKLTGDSLQWNEKQLEESASYEPTTATTPSKVNWRKEPRSSMTFSVAIMAM